MPIDRRLREDLGRDANRIHVDIERNLGAVQARVRHRGPSLLIPAIAAAAVLAIVIGLRFAPPNAIGGPTGTPSASAGANPFEAIAGIYRATLDAPDDASVAGSWTMELRRNGTLVLAPPTTFSYGSIAPSGISYTIEGDRLRTDMFYNDFCASVGAYTWSLRGDVLTLSPASESCAIRKALLATSPWTRLP